MSMTKDKEERRADFRRGPTFVVVCVLVWITVLSDYALACCVTDGVTLLAKKWGSFEDPLTICQGDEVRFLGLCTPVFDPYERKLEWRYYYDGIGPYDYNDMTHWFCPADFGAKTVYHNAGTYYPKLIVLRTDAPHCPDDTNDTCTVHVVGVVDVNAGGKMKGETLYLANDYLDEPSKREDITQGVIAEFYPAGVGTPDCFFWSPGCGSLPKICPSDANVAIFTAKDHGTEVITATAGTSSESVSIAIEGIDIKTANISDACEMTETYNIFLNENFDAWYYWDTNTLPGHSLCMNVDYNYPYIYYWYGYSEIGDINLSTKELDNAAEVNFVTATPAIIRLHKSVVEPLAFNTWYAAGTLPDILSVDGMAEGTTTLKAIIKTRDGFTAEDELKIKVIRLNLKAVDPAPCSDRHEVCHADKLIIAVNNNDSDDDGIVDWSDSDIAGGDPDLAKITLEKPAGAVASDISGNITVKFSPKVKAFKDPNKATGLAPTSYSFSALPVDIYLEGNTPSSSVLDANVWAEMTLDSGVKCHDEIWYTVVDVRIKNPIDSDDDGVIDDDATSGNNYTGNEFTFSTATDGVLTMPCRVEIKPDVLGVREMFENKIRIRLSAIGTSHDPMGPYVTELVWDHEYAGESTAGNATYDAGWNLWIATATFTGLAMDNSDFGEKSCSVTVFEPTGGILFEPKEVKYEVFFPRGASNNWGGSVPNWYYYWSQVYSASDMHYVPAANFGKVPAIVDWSYTVAQDKDRVEIGSGHPAAYRSYGVSEFTSGIDRFIASVIHEEKHVDQVSSADTLLPTSGNDSFRYGWSWNQATHNHWTKGPDGQWGVAGVDDDNNGTTDDAKTTPPFEPGNGDDVSLDHPIYVWWPNSWPLPNPNLAPHPIESEAVNAQDAGVDEDDYADDDWGNPGKKHKTYKTWND